MYNNPNAYYGNQYGNSYYNNVYNYVTPVPAVVQSNAPANNVQTSNSTHTPASNNNASQGTDWSDGVGGPERYTSKTKKISDYKVE